VNVLVPAEILAAALPHLKPDTALVNISSVNAVLPPYGASIYGASKGALNNWTRAMAKELGLGGINVNAIESGAINSLESPRLDAVKALFVAVKALFVAVKALFVKEIALGRIGRPDGITKAVRFLASEDAGFITGEVLTLSGGGYWL